MSIVVILNVNVENKLLPHQKKFHLESNGLKITLEKLFKEKQTAWKKFLKPAVNLAAPFFWYGC